jgi:aminopeptidase N
MPIAGSLNELSSSFIKVEVLNPILSFNTSLKPSFVKEYKQEFPNLLSAMKSFNKIGATNHYSKKISHNDVKKAGNFFNGEITWKVGFFSLD